MPTHTPIIAKQKPSRKPTLLACLQKYTKDKLVFAARQLCVSYSKLKKNELAEKLATEMQNPEIAGKRFAIMPDENIHAFEAALDKKCFLPNNSEYALLLPFISMGYIAAYDDSYLEAVKEARTLYKKLNTPAFQSHRKQLAWLLDCITAMSSLHLCVPVEFFCDMYKQREGFSLTPGELRQLLADVPNSFNPCLISDGNIQLKSIDDPQILAALEQARKNLGLYLPTADEITQLSHYGYLQSNSAYQNLYDFFATDLAINTVEAHYWCQYIYEYENVFELRPPASLIQKLQDNIPVWSNYKHLGKFSVLLQAVHNSGTRMFCLGGHTPDEATKLAIAKKNAAKPNGRVGTKAKKIYPNDPCPCGSGKKYKKCCGKKN